MPSSTVSLEPLSSPSPSPPPPEPTTRSSNSSHSGAAAGLDSGSELSELTDDDQENDNAEDEDERPRPTRRKKRGGIVPAPMWDWAYKKTDSSWRTKPIEEEEEEEPAGPAEAMEEEEDEGHDGRGSPDAIFSTVRASISLPGAPGDAENDPEEEDTPEDEDDVPEADDDQPTVRATSRPLDNPPSDDDDADPPAHLHADDAPPTRPATRLASPDLSDEENTEEDQVIVDTGVDDEEPQDPEPDAESDNDAEIADSRVLNDTSAPNTPTPVVSTTLKVTTALTVVTVTKKAEPDVSTTPMGVDDDTPMAVAVAHSSIMAGANVVIPPSPSSASSSASGSPRPSPSPSRSPSTEPVSDRELDAKASNGRVLAKGKAVITGRPQHARLTRNRSRRKTKTTNALELDGGDSSRLGVDGDDRDIEDADEVDIDSPDLELESDVLPVHRAEALDVLAQIELKFALLREKLYVEKMEGLAWEEALIAEDDHPELLHLQAELDKRRNKRLDLAARRRDFEVANITKRRKLDEDGVWSWWKSARDDLQAEMTSETNRRRRKLDRERRNLDRPQPTRVIPGPPFEVPIPPTVYEIVKADPFNASRSSKSRKQEVSAQLVYPRLASLTQDEVMQDIDFIFRPRTMAYDVARQGMMGSGPVIGPPLSVPPGFDPFGMILDGPVLSRYGPGPPPPPLQHISHPHSQLPSGFPGPSNTVPRMLSHIAPQPMPHPLMMDIDSSVIRRPSSVPGPANLQQFSHLGPPTPIGLMRRSVSPVPAYTNGQASTLSGPSSSFGGLHPQGWMTEDVPGPSSHLISAKDRRPNGSDQNGLDRDKNRDRPDSIIQKDRNERERDEREILLLQQQAPRHVAHTHAHTHVHGGAQNNHRSHRHVVHHHHVLHHHHPTNGPDGSGPLPGGSNGDRVNGSALVSPHMREIDLHRPRSGAPTEVIDLLSSPMKLGHQGHPPMSTFRKANDEQPLSAIDRDRGRGGYGPPSAGLHERTAPPSYGMNYPPSPRHGLSTAPGSRAPSRRGSFSAMEDSGPRPSSSQSVGPLASNHQPLPATSPTLHRPMLNSHGGRLQTSPILQPQHSSLMVSPRGNAIRLPPISPSNASSMVGSVRSPVRTSQALPPPPPPPSHSQSNSKPPSPVEVRRRSPPPSQIRSPLIREPVSHSGHPRTSSPMVMLSHSSLPQAHPPPRLPPVGLSEKRSPNLPKMKAQAVPIDGP